MSDYHHLLLRQIAKHFASEDDVPDDVRALLRDINEVFTTAEIDRASLSRSLRESSDELTHASAELRAVFQELPDLFVWFGEGGDIVREERGRDPARFPSAAELSANPVMFHARRRTLESGAPVIVEARIDQKGRDEHFEARFMPLLAGEVLGIIRNVTARVRATGALAQEKERLADTLRSINIAVITTDRFGRVVLINNIAETMLGVRAGDVEGNLLTDLVLVGEGNEKAPLRDRIDAVQATERTWSVDAVPLTAATGQRAIIDVRASPIIERGVPDGVVVVFRDVAERVRLVEERLRSSKLESIGLLAGGIAHDFNNILQALLGSLSLAEHRASQGEDVVDLISRARKASSRARDLTTQLLAVSRGGAPVKNVASIGQLIEESSTFAVRGTNLRCELEIAPDLAAVEVDEGQVSQVVQNLVLNAAQAMPEGGVVTIGAENVSRLGVPPSEVRLYITDQGTGISPGDQARLFDPYFTTKESGTGLGLYTVYVVVKRHGGRIEVDSVPDVGTTFSIYLPTTSGEPKLAEAPHALEGGLGRVLVMDDEDAARRTTTEMLEYLGYTPAATCEGREAVACFREAASSARGFDIALLDLTVPGGQGGAETVRELTSTTGTAPITIAMTGYANDAIVENYREHGFDAVLVKPFTVFELDRTLRFAAAGR